VLRGMLIGIAVGLLVAWVALAVALVAGRPKGSVLRDAMGLLPDTIRLLRNIATDRSLPRGIRVRLWLLIASSAYPSTGMKSSSSSSCFARWFERPDPTPWPGIGAVAKMDSPGIRSMGKAR
jgi:hypothetical protein